jgi:hypothetical protein
MTDSGEQPPLLDYRLRTALVGVLAAPQNLQRDFTIEPSVPGTIDIAKGSASDGLDDLEGTPGVSR